ncbi:hypothetical protein PQS31_01455 [Luteimonas sp BLCC-B24]|uniref:hypothetical protein n=1 Tax=Luteimonas sp. BLCC-B24 TaxID=3025317 RepID=UPI00234E00F9|nr:hypothetical protein [Luteimonas sp. BLCC-B24]MDC7805497.1 hypothetical protein [Luteimonas sp. BLCC-B24]
MSDRRRNRRWSPPLSFGTLALACACTAFAQSPEQAGPQNTRMEYAQVLRAEPVYQTLRATSMVERCEATTPVLSEQEERRGLARVVGAVKDVLRSEGDAVQEVDRSAGGDCRMVPIEREFRRPIAFDVDYVHKGVKYRSRLPYDPGNRLRVRVTVTPIVTPADAR